MTLSPHFQSWLQSLEAALQQPLPGLQQQLRMAPPYREVPSEAWVQAQNPKIAAVLAIFTWEGDSIELIFTKRKSYAGVHSNQVSFPGGKAEPEDSSLLATALRESAEEIGLDLESTQVLGALSPLYIPPSNFLVHPYVAVSTGAQSWQLQADEVAELLSIPLSHLQSANSRAERSITVAGGSRVVPGFVWQEHFIWGATAMMLEELLAVVGGS